LNNNNFPHKQRILASIYQMSAVTRNSPFGNDFTIDEPQRASRRRVSTSKLHLSSSNLICWNCNTENALQTMPDDHASIENDKLKASETGNLNMDSTVDSWLAPLFTNNNRISVSQEKKLILDSVIAMQHIDAERLDDLKEEIGDYDPRSIGVIDSPTFQRLLARCMKPANLQPSTLQGLLLMFALDVRKPRQVLYKPLLDYLKRIQIFSKENKSLIPECYENYANLERSEKYSSPYCKPSDVKLLADIKEALNKACAEDIDLTMLEKELNHIDPQNTSFLREKQIQDVLKRTKLQSTLQHILPRLLDRCELRADLRYDWKTFLQFLNEAQKAHHAEQNCTQVSESNQIKTEVNLETNDAELSEIKKCSISSNNETKQSSDCVEAPSDNSTFSNHEDAIEMRNIKTLIEALKKLDRNKTGK
ncbi:hypothetical protein T4B_10874, partial [Trichinella pseudospiralis]